MNHEGKVEFDEVMAAAHSIVLEMNATIKDFILQLAIGSVFSVADIISRAARYDCEHCGVIFRDFKKYSDHIVKMHSFPVEYSKKWEKLKAVPDPLASAEQLASAMSSTMFQDQAFEVKAEPSQMVKVEMNCDDDDEEARELEEALRNPIMIRQSATEEAPFYKCKVCSQLLPCSNNEADTERIDKHLKNHKMEKVERAKKYEQNQRICPIKRKERSKISNKKYYEQNKDKNKQKSREASKKYYEQNKDKMKQKIKENNKKYYEQKKKKQKIKEEDQQVIDDTEEEDDQKGGNEVGEFYWEYEDEKVKDELVDPKLMDDSKSKSCHLNPDKS